MKKSLSLLLAVLMILALTPAFAQESVPEITWLISVGTTSDENNIVLDAIEEAIGVRVKPIQVSTGDFDSKLNTLIAARELPDMFSASVSDAAQFINEGMLMPLDGLLAEYGQNILNIVGDALPQAPANKIDGQTYMILSGSKGYMENLAVRKDWLEALDLEVPTTTDELFDVLYAFTYDDPDGNDIDDTIGIVMPMVQSNQWENIFGAFGVPYNQRYLLEDGTVTSYLKAPGFIEAVKYLNKLYHAGVMDPDFATMPAMTAHEKLWSGKVGVYGFRSVGTTNNWYPGRYTFDLPEDPADMFVFAQVAGPDGYCGSVEQYQSLTGGFVVSATCANPEAVIKFIDYMYTEEGDTLLYLGVEGVMYEWTDKENGKYQRLGVYTDDAMHRAHGGFTYWQQRMPNGIEMRTMNALTQQSQLEQQQYAISYPYIINPLETATQYGAVLSDIVKEALAALIITDGDIDAEYAAFVTRWENEGGTAFEEEATEAYELQNS